MSLGTALLPQGQDGERSRYLVSYGLMRAVKFRVVSHFTGAVAMTSQQRDASSPVPWPPIIYLSAALVAGLMSWAAGWPFLPGTARDYALACGVGVIFLGANFLVLAGLRFNRAKTPIPPNVPTKTLVFDGVYKYTRNPMYLGMTLVLAGLSLMLNQLWFVIAVPIAVYAVTKLAIEREEEYLARRFGEPYLDYTAKVRRWF